MGFLRYVPALTVALMLSGFPRCAPALTLTEVWLRAQDNDPDFRSAVSEAQAGKEFASIGRAALLPQVSASWQYGPQNWQRQKYRQSRADGQRDEVTRHQQYSSYSGSVSLVQPLFDYDAWARYRIGVARSLFSVERFRGKVQDLTLRVINAWLDLAQASEKMTLLTARIALLQQQQLQTQRLFQAGEGTLTDIRETEAELNMAQAEALEQRDVQEAAQRALEAIAGGPLRGDLAGMRLRTDMPLRLSLRSSHYSDWEKIALVQNPDIQTAVKEVLIKRGEIERQRAGFMPSIEAYAMHSENSSSSDNTVHQKYRTDSVGIRVSIPLYAGGATAASTRQAAAEYAQAQYTRDARRQDVFNQLHDYFNQCLHSPVKIKARLLAVASAQLQVQATRRSVAAGQRVNLDLLNAEQQLYQARVDLSSAQYAYIKAWAGLHEKAGVLAPADIAVINHYFMEKH